MAHFIYIMKALLTPFTYFCKLVLLFRQNKSRRGERGESREQTILVGSRFDIYNYLFQLSLHIPCTYRPFFDPMNPIGPYSRGSLISGVTVQKRFSSAKRQVVIACVK